MENPLHVLPAPSRSSVSSSAGLRRSSTSWKLSNMAQMLDDPERSDTESDTSSESSLAGSPRLLLRKPPRHSNVPMCAQILLKLWQRELRRSDVSITSDLFEDLHASDEQAFFLVDRMQRMGLNITLQQFFALRRCCIYSVLLVAL